MGVLVTRSRSTRAGMSRWACSLVSALACVAPAAVSAVDPAFRNGPPITGFAGKSAYEAIPLRIDADGNDDLAVMSLLSVTTWQLNVLHGTGDGGFAAGTQPWERVTLPFGGLQMRAGDVTGDGRADAIFLGWEETATLPVTRSLRLYLAVGDPRGGFAYSGVVHTIAADATAIQGSSFALGDTNGDAKLDIVYVDANAAQVRNLLGNGTGGFSPGGLAFPVVFNAGRNVGEVVTADLNNDSRSDVVVGAGQALSVLLADPSSATGFAAATSYATSALLFSEVGTADTNRDGLLDLVTSAVRLDQSGLSSGSDPTVYRALGRGAFDPNPVLLPTGPDPWVAEQHPDLNGDGYPDIVAHSGVFGPNAVVVPSNDGAPPSPAVSFPVGTVTGFAFSDLNHDGRTDLMTRSSDGVRVLMNTTPYPPPKATTGAAVDVTRSSATLTGTVGPRDQLTSYSFEYGPTTAYGNRTAETSVAGGVAAPASAKLTGQNAGVSIHYRLVATNRFGTTVGDDRVTSTPGLVDDVAFASRWRLSRQLGSLVITGLPRRNGTMGVTVRSAESGRVLLRKTLRLGPTTSRSSLRLPKGLTPGTYAITLTGPDDAGEVTQVVTQQLAPPREGYARAFFSRYDGSAPTNTIRHGARVIWVNYRFVTPPVGSRQVTQACTGPVRIAATRRAYKRSLTISLPGPGVLPRGRYTCTVSTGRRPVAVARASVLIR